jgi:hypothetical protein
MTTAPYEAKFGEKVVALQVNYGAAVRISNYFDGLVPANRALANVDASAMRKILAVGLNKPIGDNDGIDQMIFDAGAVSVQSVLLDYLDRLATGGRGTPKPGIAA